MKWRRVFGVLAAGLLTLSQAQATAQTQGKPKQAETGKAKPPAKFERKAFGLVWRDLDSALQEAKKTGKLVFCARTLGDLFGGDL